VLILRGSDLRFTHGGQTLAEVDYEGEPPELEFIPPVDEGRAAVRAWAEKGLAEGLSCTASMTLDADDARVFFDAIERVLPPEPPLLTATFTRPALRIVRRRDRTRSRLSTASSSVTGRVVGGGLEKGVLELTFDAATNVPRRRAARGRRGR
jgi:hypothetical protein